MLFGEVIILFAQRFNQGGFNQGGAGGGIGGAGACCVQFLVVALQIGYAVWFFMTTYKALDACSPRNRDMEPGMVFLALIPLFNIVWVFIIVFRIASSLEKEFRTRGLRGDGDFGATLGMWGLICNILCCFVGIVLNIMWLVKVTGYTKMLTEGGRKRRRIRDDDDDNDDDDDDDDRPSKRRSRDDDDDDDDDDRPRKRRRRSRDDDDD